MRGAVGPVVLCDPPTSFGLVVSRGIDVRSDGGVEYAQPVPHRLVAPGPRDVLGEAAKFQAGKAWSQHAEAGAVSRVDHRVFAKPRGQRKATAWATSTAGIRRHLLSGPGEGLGHHLQEVLGDVTWGAIGDTYAERGTSRVPTGAPLNYSPARWTSSGRSSEPTVRRVWMVRKLSSQSSTGDWTSLSVATGSSRTSTRQG